MNAVVLEAEVVEDEDEGVLAVDKEEDGVEAIITTPMRKMEGDLEVWIYTLGLVHRRRGLACAFPTLVVGIL